MLARLHGIIVACALAGACEPTQRRTPDDTLVVIAQEPAATADPRFALSSYEAKVSKLVYAGLTALDTETLQARMDLAERIDRVSDTVIDVTLRAGARFSDGSPVTAKDVADYYWSVIEPNAKSIFHKGYAERFSAVTAIKPGVVRFTLHKPLGTFASDIDFGIASTKGLGAGPYVVRELSPTRILLDRNPYYPNPPKLPHVEIRTVRNDAARTLMLVGGSADLAQNAVRLDLVDDVAERARVRVTSAPSVILTYLMMNNAAPPFDDVRVRQAIALALDRPTIIKAKLGGRAVLATGLLPPSHWAYEGAVARYDHDLARARQLLDEAGLRDPDGAGPRPRIELTYKTSTDAFRVTLAKLIAAQLAEVGIAVEVRPFEFATFFADIKKGNYQLASMQTGEINEPDLLHNYFHSERIPDKKAPDGGNRWRYRNRDVDALLDAGRRELDAAKRKVIYADVQKRIAADVPIVPLWHEDNIVIANGSVTGYRIVPNARLIGLVSATKN